MFQSAVCWGMWSYLTWTSPGVPRRRSVWAPPPSPALGTKLSHKHNHTLATPGLQLCASHRREMGKTLHQGDRINLKTNPLAKSCLTPAVPEEKPADLHDKQLKRHIDVHVILHGTDPLLWPPFYILTTLRLFYVWNQWRHFYSFKFIRPVMTFSALIGKFCHCFLTHYTGDFKLNFPL